MRTKATRISINAAIVAGIAGTLMQSCSDPFSSCAQTKRCPFGGAAGMMAAGAGPDASDAGNGGQGGVTKGVGGNGAAGANVTGSGAVGPSSAGNGASGASDGGVSDGGANNAGASNGTGGSAVGGASPTLSGGVGSGGSPANANGGNAGGVTASGSGGGAAQGGAGGTGQKLCVISGKSYAEGSPNPNNSCQVCSPAKSTSAWSSATDGGACGAAGVCVAGTCQDGCWIESKYYAVGAANPKDGCQFCEASGTAKWGNVPTSTCATAISAGFHHVCMIVNGGVLCWGANASGQLGNNTTVASVKPVAAALPYAAQSVALGDFHTCALSNGSIACWGDGGTFQLGNGSTTTSRVPITVIASGVSGIGVGRSASCVMTTQGVDCVGTVPQMGGRPTAQKSFVPVSNLQGAQQVALHDLHACALLSGGVWCWGFNPVFGLGLGDGSGEGSDVPLHVSSLSGATAISVYLDSTCAIANGAAFCWGANSWGQLGTGSTTDAKTPVQVSGLSSGVTQIALGATHACAIAEGRLLCWGYNATGALGDNTTVGRLIPTPVIGMTIGVTAVTAGDGYTCAIKNGAAYCWGSNPEGRLGNSSTEDARVPVKVALP